MKIENRADTAGKDPVLSRKLFDRNELGSTHLKARPHLRILVLLMTVSLLSLLTSSLPLGYAQNEEPWTTPICLSQGILNVSSEPARALFPRLVADDWGNVHAFWPAAFEVSTVGDSLFYARWDGVSWSAPSDILYRPGHIIWLPEVVVDHKGWLHVAWTEGVTGPVWYSHAFVDDAASARAWSTPVRLSEDWASSVTISADSESRVHIIYSAQVGEDGEDRESLYHIDSVDGQVWSDPVLIAEGEQLGRGGGARIAIDKRDHLHVVFRFEDAAVIALHYTRSNDRGRTWLTPLEMDRKDERYTGTYAPNAPNIAAIGNEELHLVWFGAPSGHRWHRWSGDGGATWSTAELIDPSLRLSTWPPAMAVDSSGILHLMSLGGGTGLPLGVYHTFWNSDRWAPLMLISDQGDEQAALAIAGGNVLHVVWDYQDDEAAGSIWASRLQVDAPALTPDPPPSGLPTSIPTATTAPMKPTPTSTMPAVRTAVPSTPISIDVALPPASQEIGLWLTIGVGTLPILFLTGILLLIRMRKRHRNTS